MKQNDLQLEKEMLRRLFSQESVVTLLLISIKS